MLGKLLIASLLCFSSLAIVFLDIEITHEKGLGEMMILKSELMSRERAGNGKEIFLQMKNGIQLRLTPHFDDQAEELDENSLIKMNGILQDISATSRAPRSFVLSVKVNLSGEVEFKTDEGQRTRVKVTPKIK